MNILELLSLNPDKEVPLSEISSALSLDKGTCTNILKTLSSRGYVQQNAPRSGYKLGYKMYRITGRSVENEELTKIARGDVSRLGERFNETSLLSVVRNDKRVVLYGTEPNRALIVRTADGKSVYTACTGRAIIANYLPSHLEKLIIRLGLPTADEWPEIYMSGNPSGELMNLLAKIRADGYASYLDRNGIVGFAAPIFKCGHVVGGVGIYLPESRMKDHNVFRDAVMECAGSINDKLERIEGLYSKM